MDPLQLTSFEIDSQDKEAHQRYLDLVGDTGAFYHDADDAERLIFNPPGTSIVQILEKKHVSEVLCNMGALELQVVGRRGTEPMYATLCPAYHKRLTSYLNHHLPNIHLPKVRGYYQLPAMVEESGQLYVATPGYHKRSGLLFLGHSPTAEQLSSVNPTYPHLHRWLSDIHFTSDEYRGNLMAYLVASFARNLCEEFPLLVLDSTSKKQGKTTVASAFVKLLTGSGASPATHTGDEGEIEKRVGGEAERPGPCVCFLDNVRPKRGQSGTIRSQLFAAGTTNARPKVRPCYGRRLVPLNYPIFLLTMNGASMEPDLVDRSVRVILTGVAGRYFRPNPVTYVEEHRAELVKEILHMLKRVDLTRTCEHQSRFGLFEKIAQQAAEMLCLPLNLSPHAVDTADAFVKELVASWRELEEEHDQPPSWERLSEHVRMARNLTELSDFFQRNHASSDKARGKLLRAEVERVSKERLFVNGKEIKLHVFEDRMQVEEL